MSTATFLLEMLQYCPHCAELRLLLVVCDSPNGGTMDCCGGRRSW